MAAGLIETVVRLQYASNIGADVAINTFHAELSDTSDTSNYAAWHNRLWIMFNSVNGTQTASLVSYLSPYINRTNGATINSYRLDDPKPRAPYYTSQHSLGASSSTGSLPFEVALCISYKATGISGVPAGRLRNRFYLGPLNLNAAVTTANVPSRPDTTLISNATKALVYLDSVNTAQVAWAGWSEVGGIGWSPSVGWVDNEWDTQRRRGTLATSRTTVSL